MARRSMALVLVGLLGCGKMVDGQPSAIELTQRRSAIQSSTPSTARGAQSQFAGFHAPAGDRPTTLATTIDGRSGAILPNGRFVTPAGSEVSVGAPKPFGLALSPDGQTAATINSGASRFSVTLVRGLRTATPTTTLVPIDAAFMGVVFSADGARFFASGGDDGNIWVGDTASGTIIGSVNLNGATHPLDRPLAPATTPALAFKDLRRRGRHPERARPRRRLPFDLPGHRAVGEARERDQAALEPGQHLQDRRSDPGHAAAQHL